MSMCAGVGAGGGGGGGGPTGLPVCHMWEPTIGWGWGWGDM